MKGIWGLAGLAVALAIVALLAKQHLGGARQTLAAPATAGNAQPAQLQSQQIQQQVRQALEAGMATRREESEAQ